MKTNNANCRFSLFEEIDKGLNHLVKEVLNQDGATKSVPPLAVFELAQSYVIECDLPGVNLEDVSLQVENGVLEISGHRRDVTPDGAKVTVNERSFAEFSRKLQLSKDINAEGIDAELGHGILRVTVPKATSTLPRKVQVRKAAN